MNRLFCLFLAFITFHFSFSGCASSRILAEVDMMDYKSRNMEVIEKDIKEKSEKVPVKVRDKEVVIHINQGPVAGVMFEPEFKFWKGIDLGNGNEDKQLEMLKTIKTTKNELGVWFISRDYTKALSAVLEKQLGRYFSKVRVIDNDTNDTKAPGKGIGVKSLFNFDEYSGGMTKATVTVTATLPAGAPITATGTYEYHHTNTTPLVIIAIVLYGGLIGIIPMLIAVSIKNRANAGSVWQAMNIACENLASRLAPRIAAMKERIIDIEIAVTGVQIR